MKQAQALDIRERMLSDEPVTEEERTLSGKYWRRELRGHMTRLENGIPRLANAIQQWPDESWCREHFREYLEMLRETPATIGVHGNLYPELEPAWSDLMDRCWGILRETGRVIDGKPKLTVVALYQRLIGPEKRRQGEAPGDNLGASPVRKGLRCIHPPIRPSAT